MKILLVFLALASLSRAELYNVLHGQPLDYEAATTTTTEGPPNPYSFQYSAGRFPGHVDRVQSEAGDGYGRVQGSYSFIDPKFKVRTVQYTVDENGYHPTLINYDDVLRQPQQSEAVRRETERQRILYDNIAARNSQGIPSHPPRYTVQQNRYDPFNYDDVLRQPQQSEAVRLETERHRILYDRIADRNSQLQSGYYDDVLREPQQSEAVRRETERHRIIYDRIADRNSQYQSHPPRESANVQRARNRHLNLYHKIASEHAAIGAERALKATSTANDVNQSETYFQ